MLILVTGDIESREICGQLIFPMDEVVSRKWGEYDALPGVPDLVIIAQTRRGQFTQQTVYGLVTKFPLAKKVILTGAWCEGETRSGLPLAGIKRIPVSEWLGTEENQLAKERGLSKESVFSRLARPDIETRADFLLADETVNSLDTGLIGMVHSRNIEFIKAISEFCEARGGSNTPYSRDNNAQYLIIDCHFGVQEAIELVAESNSLVDQRFPVPSVVACGFWREHDREMLSGMFDCFALIDKPFDNQLLESLISTLLRQQANTGSETPNGETGHGLRVIDAA